MSFSEWLEEYHPGIVVRKGKTDLTAILYANYIIWLDKGGINGDI